MNTILKTILTFEANRLLDELLCDSGTFMQKKKGVRNYLIGLLMLDAGLRVGEVTSLLVTDLTFAGEPVHSLNVTKEIARKRAERTIPLTKRIQTAIRVMSEFWWVFPESPVAPYAFFETDSDHPISVRQIERIIRAAALTSIGQSIHPHVLRHTFATRLMMTTNTRVVQALLGHKSLQSTQIYTHPNNQHLKAAIDSLGCEESDSS